jgi:hypothetical protein
MRTLLLVGLTLFVTTNAAPSFARDGACRAHKKASAAAGKKSDSTPAADPNAVLAKSHGGKIWILGSATPNVEGTELGKWLDGHPSANTVTKKANEERWPITFLAVFKHAPAKGPATVQFVDKKEPGTLVDQYSTESTATSVVMQEPYDLDSNNGFNKDHTYIIKIGQIIKNKFVPYASGEITLK